MRFAKPLDKELLHTVFKNYKKIITVEDSCLMGGFGSAILEFAADNNYYLPIQRLGIPDKIFEHGTQMNCMMKLVIKRNILSIKYLIIVSFYNCL